MTANAQDTFYGTDRDYLTGSPHLRHRHLNHNLLNLVFDAIDSAISQGLPPKILEIGGGDGAITEPLLATGLSVTTTEMSAASIERLKARFGKNDRFNIVHDLDGSFSVLDDTRYSCVLYSSVLHHIPDYLGVLSQTVNELLLPQGSLVTLQDPLWYSRLHPFIRRLSSASYLSWRLFQGNLFDGGKARLRRATKGPNNEEISDSVEYHVVRDGVDELAVIEQLEPHFDKVQLHKYWSSQGPMQQRTGEMIGALNTFAISATGLR